MVTLLDEFEQFLEIDGPEMDFVVQRDSIEEGTSFSAEALDAVSDQIIMWMGSRILRAWNQRNEPPSHLKISVSVEVA